MNANDVDAVILVRLAVNHSYIWLLVDPTTTRHRPPPAPHTRCIESKQLASQQHDYTANQIKTKTKQACKLAVEYRAACGKDAFVDLHAYRLHGHNEARIVLGFYLCIYSFIGFGQSQRKSCNGVNIQHPSPYHHTRV